MNLEFIKPVYGAVKSVNGMTGDVVIEVPEANLEGYATEEYVAKKIAEAELAEGEVDLSAYYTKSETEAKIDEKIAAIEIPEPEIPDVDLSDYYNKAEVDAKIEEIELTPGEPGAPGKDGKDGQDYILTEEDKKEIAGMVEVTGGGAGDSPMIAGSAEGSAIVPGQYGAGAAGGKYSVSLGGGNAWGVGSLALGNYSTTSAQDAVAILGSASKYGAVAIGSGTTADNSMQVAIGRYNVSDTKANFVVGNAWEKSASEIIPQNAMVTYGENNEAYFPGKVTVGADREEVATKAYVDEHAGSGGGTAYNVYEHNIIEGDYTDGQTVTLDDDNHELLVNSWEIWVDCHNENMEGGLNKVNLINEDGVIRFENLSDMTNQLFDLSYDVEAHQLQITGTGYFKIFVVMNDSPFYTRLESDSSYARNEQLSWMSQDIMNHVHDNFYDKVQIDDMMANSGGGGSAAVDNTTIVQNPDGTISTAIGGGRVLVSEPVTYIDYNDETGVTNPDYQTTACYVPLEQFDYHVFDDASKEYLLTIEVRDASNGDARTEYHGLCTIATDSYGATINPVAWTDFSAWFSRFYYGGGSSVYVAFSKQAWQTADKIYVTRFTLEEPAQFDYQYIDSAFLNLDGDSFNVKDGMISTKLSGLNSIKSQAVVAQDTFNINSLYSKNTQILAFGTDINLTDGYYNATYYTTKDAIVLGSGNVVGCVYGTAVGRANGLTGNNLLAFGSGLSLQGHNKAAYGFCNEYGSDATVQIGVGANVSSRLTGLTIDSTGNVVTKGTVSNGGADYAEYFEWVDGNPEAEDRIGYMVTLEGDKIRFAAPGDEILGIISGTAAMIGDDAQWHWSKKYLTDEFGRIQHEYVEIKTEAFDADGNPVEVVEKVETLKLNPDWDENASYVSRKERKEWDIVGLFGKLYVRDDGTCAVGGYASVGANGVATNSAEKTNMRVMERVNDNIIKVFMK